MFSFLFFQLNASDFLPFLLVHIVLIRFVKGSKPGDQSGFDIDQADLMELEQFHEVIVASAIFGTTGHKTFYKDFLNFIHIICLSS